MKIGVLSDAHGNREGFVSAISHLRKLGANSFYFLGDSVGYIPCVGVVDELMSLGKEIQCILGNHEIMLLFNPAHDARDLVYRHELTRQRLSNKQISFLRLWPDNLRLTIDGQDILFVHGSPLNFIDEYVYPDSDLEKFKVDVAYVFMGHSHYPFIRRMGNTTFVNVGSCGLPRDDGRYGAFALLDTTKLHVEIYRYDISKTYERFIEDVSSEIHNTVFKLFKRRSSTKISNILD